MELIFFYNIELDQIMNNCTTAQQLNYFKK
jgi:hypothetical protein